MFRTERKRKNENTEKCAPHFSVCLDTKMRKKCVSLQISLVITQVHSLRIYDSEIKKYVDLLRKAFILILVDPEGNNVLLEGKN